MIRFATDCSGLDAPFYALQNLLGISKTEKHVTYVFASELDPHLRHLLSHSIVKPLTVYDDVTTRNVDDMQSVDLYVCGFPCQSFSMFGQQHGLNDERGHVFYYVYSYIKKHQPKIFLLENVVGLLHNNRGQTFRLILNMLNEIGVYTLDYKVVSPIDVGIPQHRQRVFIVGIHRQKTNIHSEYKMVWPENSNNVQPLSDLLLDVKTAKLLQPRAFRPLTKHGLSNVKKAEALIPDIHQRLYVFDVRLSKYFYLSPENVCPCLTKFGMSYYISSQGRYLTCLEAMRIQGLDNDHLLEKLGVCDPQIKNKTRIFYAVGNSMCVHVVVAVMDPLIKLLM
jgi:DNA-cytosine methyltransferase